MDMTGFRVFVFLSPALIDDEQYRHYAYTKDKFFIFLKKLLALEYILDYFLLVLLAADNRVKELLCLFNDYNAEFLEFRSQFFEP